jgi:hypothetical protein
MRNFKIYIDLSDIYLEVKLLDIKEMRDPFDIVFLESDNPDAACYEVVQRYVKAVMSNSKTIEDRILCEKIKKYLRIDKIESL